MIENFPGGCYPVLYHRNVTLYVNCITFNEYNYVYVIKMWNDTIFGHNVQVCVYS